MFIHMDPLTLENGLKAEDYRLGEIKSDLI